MGLPDNVDDTTGALYVVTHAREYNREQWTEALISYLTGEQGEDTKHAVQAIAARMGISLPPEFE